MRTGLSRTLLPATLVITLAFAMVVSATVSTTAPATTTQPQAAGAQPWQTLATALESERRAHNVPALGLIVLDTEQPRYVAAFGNWTPDTPFRWGSISKSFTALGALSLVERGELALDAPVRAYLPDGIYANRWFPDRPLRLEHLLALTSGLGAIRIPMIAITTNNSTSVKPACPRRCRLTIGLSPMGDMTS